MDEVYRIPLPPRRQAELVWRRSHENILEFLAGVPAGRQHRLCFEDLVRGPREAVEALCRFLALPFHSAMLAPYEGERMTDGLESAGRMMGDPKFHHHRQIDAAVADRWRSALGAVRFGEATWKLAERLGYPRPATATPTDASAGGDAGASPRPLPPIRPLPPRPEWPLAPAQERLWFIAQLERSGSLYSMPGVLRMRGPLRWQTLGASLEEIVRRHATLRTRFVAVGGRPMQVVDADWRPDLPLVDLGGLSRAVGAEESAGLLAAKQGPAFDLAAGPLLRATLVRVAEGDFILLVTLHHIVSDGWSIGLLLRELTAIYAAFERGRPSPLPELPVQYTDFAVWQREWLSGELLDEQLGYWKGQLADVPALDLPTDRPPQAGQTFRAGTHTLVVPQALAAGLHTLAGGERASLFMALLAVYQVLLHRHSGQDDIAVGIPIAARNRAEIEPLIGFFVNTLVLRTRLGAQPSFRELLARVRAVTLAAYEHQDLPFSVLVEALRPRRGQGSTALFDAMLTLQNQPSPMADLPGFDLALLPRGEGDVRTQFALVLNLRETGGELVGTLAYNSALLDRSTGARWRDHCLHLLTALVAEPERPVGELPLLTAGERHQVLLEWGEGGKIVLNGDLPAPIGVRGEIGRAGVDGSLERTGRRGHRRVDGSLAVETVGAQGEETTSAAGAPSGLLANPGPSAPERVPDALVEARSELSSRRGDLSSVKRELLSRRLSGQLAGRAVQPAAAVLPETVVDLAAEAVLDPAIGRQSAPALAPAAGESGESGEKALLLTGATGFLGGYLLSELLRQTRADVLCLVRGESVAEATRRLKASLESYGLWDDSVARRIEVVPGDLSRPLLGLSKARFETLGAEVDAIYHNGAWVNASYPYSALKATNVLGTQEVLRLAFEGRVKPVHFVSTISVFFAPEYLSLDLVPEDDELEPRGAAETAGGYAQSKWVAERMVAAARRRGLPASVYRFGRATWHSRSGLWNPSDALRHVLESCLQLGSVPDVDANLDLAPVDYLAAAIVALSRQRRSPGRAFHLLSPQEISWRELVGWLRSLGHAIDLVPFDEWLAVAKSQASAASLPHLLRLGGLRVAATGGTAGTVGIGAGPRRFQARIYDTRNALSGLEGTGIVCPELTPELLQVFLTRYALGSGQARPALVKV
jgi:thioester reductase-like protein